MLKRKTNEILIDEMRQKKSSSDERKKNNRPISSDII